MRTSDWVTSSREVTRPARRAACISGMVASTTLNRFGAGFVWPAAWSATAREKSRTIARFIKEKNTFSVVLCASLCLCGERHPGCSSPFTTEDTEKHRGPQRRNALGLAHEQRPSILSLRHPLQQ